MSSSGNWARELRISSVSPSAKYSSSGPSLIAINGRTAMDLAVATGLVTVSITVGEATSAGAATSGEDPNLSHTNHASAMTRMPMMAEFNLWPVCEVMDFVSQILPDEDERDYVLVLLASFLSGTNRNEKFHIWTGSGGNGKSKLIELYQMAIGDYGCNLPISLLTSKRKASGEASPEMARIKGRRFAVLQEPDQHTKINVGLMKEMTGGDTIQARALYKEPVEFKPQIKMILTCNHLPELPYDDEATWRRVRSVEFKAKFTDPCDVDPTDKYSHPKDEELSEKFPGWAEPFIWIILQYYKRWKEDGLKEPSSVIAFTKKYQAQNDQFRDYFDESIIKDANATEPMTMAEVWSKYTEWHSINETGTKRPKKDLQKYLEKRLGQHHMAGENKNQQGWVGYSLKQSEIFDNTSIGSSWNELDQNNG